jgi:hypothetical protein
MRACAAPRQIYGDDGWPPSSSSFTDEDCINASLIEVFDILD